MSFAQTFISEATKILEQLDSQKIDHVAKSLAEVRNNGGRIFFLGVGGSAANCSHAVNDFRKICEFEAYTPTDNVSELTARINDEGWEGVFREWLKMSHLKKEDCIFIMSVGGGNKEKNVSVNLIEAIDLAKSIGSKVFGIVGRDGGYTAQATDLAIRIPVVNDVNVTPHSEAFQAVVWHLLVSHPELKKVPTKWESTKQEPFMKRIEDLKIHIYCDGASISDMKEMYQKPYIKGFTTNPTLMRKAGITDYTGFAREVLTEIQDRPISFEVFADDFSEMKEQALKIKKWGENVFVKIPVMNTKNEASYKLIQELSHEGVKLNVTAIMTLDQVQNVAEALSPDTEAVVSVFAGRVADTGIDPVPLMREAADILKGRPKAQLLWASPRELLNVFQADEVGCHIITATPDILKKIPNVGKDLMQFSNETVKMFYDDATASGFSIQNLDTITLAHKDLEYFFFDFDGVIVDSNIFKMEAFRLAGEHYSSDVGVALAEYHKNNPALSRFEKFTHLQKNILKNSHSNDIEADLNRFRSIVKDLYGDARLAEGLKDYLNFLKEAKKTCFISSACEESEVLWVASQKNIDHFFERINGSPLSKANHIDQIYNDLGKKPGVFFGDSLKDYRAAQYGELGFVFVSDYTMQKNWSSLSEEYGYPVIRNFTSLVMR